MASGCSAVVQSGANETLFLCTVNYVCIWLDSGLYKTKDSKMFDCKAQQAKTCKRNGNGLK